MPILVRGEDLMLKVEHLSVQYGAIRAVKDVAFDVHESEIVAIVGPNGAGKTTLLRAVSGLHRPTSGTIRFCDDDLVGMAPHQIVRTGLIQVLQGRQMFDGMTVLQNLKLGAYRFGSGQHRDIETGLGIVYSYFPVLEARSSQKSGTLSGGEQVMLAIGRAMMARPKLLLLDEPSFGLAPMMVESVFQALLKLKRDGVTVVLVEQNAEMAFDLASRAYLMVLGQMVLHGPAHELRHSSKVIDLYLGHSQ
jgi:branched-chain amino acid transport system ATP-binding protein